MEIADIAWGFGARLEELSKDEHDLIARLLAVESEERGDDDGQAVGRWIADAYVARIRWREAIGDTIDTAALTKVLNCSRQAIKHRIDNHRLLAVPGRRSNEYPTWQVDYVNGEIRHGAAAWVQCWLDIEPEASPLTMAAWAAARNDELGGRCPAELIVEGENIDALLALTEAVAAARAR